MNKYNVLVLAAGLIFCLNMRAQEQRNTVIPFANVKIEGTAQGGTVTLAFIPSRGSLLTTVEIVTLPGESSNAIAVKLLQKVELLSGKIPIGTVKNNNVLRIPRFFNGQVGLKSTDSGIKSLSPLKNATIVAQANNEIKLDWTLPANVQYTNIFIFRVDGSIVASLPGNATTYTDDLKVIALSKDFETPPTTLTYWLVGFHDSIPSEHIALEIANPIQ